MRKTRLATLCLMAVAFGISSLVFADDAAKPAELLPADRPIHEVVDHYIDAQLKAENAKAAPQTDDANLIRRLTLDLAGRIPAISESKSFVESKDADKRVQLVDRLMKSPEFVQYQADLFDRSITQGQGSIRGYLTKAFTEKRGWDKMFRDILLGQQDDPMQKAALDFLKQRAKDTDQLTNDVSVVFFGVNVSCAKCHDHPLVSDWTQNHFFGMKSFFNRTFDNGGFIAERSYGEVSYKTTTGETRPAKLMFLTGTEISEPEAKEPSKDEKKKEDELFKKLAKEKKQPPAPKFSRRAQLIDVALKPETNTFFSKSIVNRVVHHMFGYGFVMPLDQMHSANPPSHPALLQWLARDLVTHNYDLRRLVRGLALSKAYSRSSRWENGERPEEYLFAVANVRALRPMQLSKSLSLASADPNSFLGDVKPDELEKRIAQSANPGNASMFEEPGDNFQVSADEALLFSNSDKVFGSYLNGGLFRRLKDIKERGKLIDTAVWSILSRAPSDEESKVLTEYVSRREDRFDDACRQVIWSLLASTEFRFNY